MAFRVSFRKLQIPVLKNLKKTTNITGHAVEPDASKKLYVIYERTLKTMNQYPEESHYRKIMGAYTQEHMNMLTSAKSIEEFEESSGRQIEECLVSARAELKLCTNQLEYRPWEKLENEAPAGQWKWP